MKSKFVICNNKPEGFDNGIIEWLGKVLDVDLVFSEGDKVVRVTPVRIAEYDSETKTLKIGLKDVIKEYGLKVEVE
ncbi:MAG: hypothetical protein IKO41_09870 [Lachnospiraceae bacterium]|nr:hypothetical protein [Lachnospiraceae bacterium]